MYTPTNIIQPDKLFEMATKYHTQISEKFHADDAEACLGRATELGSLMATTGKMLSDAKFWKDKTMRESILTQMKDFKKSAFPTSILNELIKAECKDMNYLVNFIEQVDKGVKYQHDFLITAISYKKAEMMTLNYQR